MGTGLRGPKKVTAGSPGRPRPVTRAHGGGRLPSPRLRIALSPTPSPQPGSFLSLPHDVPRLSLSSPVHLSWMAVGLSSPLPFTPRPSPTFPTLASHRCPDLCWRQAALLCRAHHALSPWLPLAGHAGLLPSLPPHPRGGLSPTRWGFLKGGAHAPQPHSDTQNTCPGRAPVNGK